jgi:hypothetical protein
MVVAVMVVLVVCPTGIVTVMPVIVLVIVVTMTRSDIYATRSNLYADVGASRSRLRSRHA